MALEQAVWNFLREMQPKKLLCLGYPDLLITDELPGIPEAKDSAQVAQWHAWRHRIYDTTAALHAMQIEPTYIDIHPSRGVERVVDLNKPLPPDLLCKFDCVLDPGTTEHCFDIAQAWMNCLWALDAEGDGAVVHTNPLSQINHGFWNVSPTAYADFYEANGFTSLDLRILYGPLDDRKSLPSKKWARFGASPEGVNLCIARRFALTEGRHPLPVMPVQRKYQKNPDLKAPVDAAS